MKTSLGALLAVKRFLKDDRSPPTLVRLWLGKRARRKAQTIIPIELFCGSRNPLPLEPLPSQSCLKAWVFSFNTFIVDVLCVVPEFRNCSGKGSKVWNWNIDQSVCGVCAPLIFHLQRLDSFAFGASR
ncbi:hypothetical protein [Allorhizobium ampelinum]|uniref:hypothetical protein n=1 Tax=Allorhizobium ampelinum TaxID=3025782 RepID=UPI001F21440B|nr:hypothetical protein [Allorhizobium ampelinum]